MMAAMKFEMMYQGRMLSSNIMMYSMKEEAMDDADILNFLASLKHCRFDVGYYDEEGDAIYTEIEEVEKFGKSFYILHDHCYAIIEDPGSHLGVHYIVLKENELVETFRQLRMKIISYLLFSFLLMGVVGYFLGRLFLRPVREQIESLDQFISDTTHELNTPISAILMTIQSLKGVDEKKMKRLEASAKRLNVMYSSLTYRLEGKEEKVELFNIAAIIAERIGYMKELMESKQLEVQLSLVPTEVKMSRASAERLVDNLLSNAVKYSDVGDSITVTLMNRVLKVTDTGIGIEKSQQEDIFKRYKRANSERGGFGIGLDIVLSICRQYGIKLDLESQKGEGSTFILTFPSSK